MGIAIPRATWCALALLLLGGCSNLGIEPEWERAGLAAREAVSSPAVWIPLATGAVIGLADSDDNISDWAIEHRPVFGSKQSASDGSDYLVGTLVVGAVASSILVPAESGVDRMALTTRSALTIGINHKATGVLKDWARRTRPDGRNDRSMPSRHGSNAFTSAALIADNLQYYDLSERGRALVGGIAYTLAAGTAWARVESAAHYPSDVLVGAALGQFVTGFLTRLMPLREPRLLVEYQPLPRGGALVAGYRLDAR